MDGELIRRAERYGKRIQRKKRWQRIVEVLGCMVMFCTTYALILPAITMEPRFLCGLEAHQHDVSCRGDGAEGTYICGMEEHTHSGGCSADLTADTETAEVWEESFSHVELSGDRGADVIAIAETQLGYTESTKNYIVAEDGTTHGYTRYGAWRETPYDPWDAAFVSFCLHYAGITDIPPAKDAWGWMEEMQLLGRFLNSENVPGPGDLIFFDWDGDKIPDHTGLTVAILSDGENENARIRTIEGDYVNSVQSAIYERGDYRILGYGRISEEGITPGETETGEESRAEETPETSGEESPVMMFALTAAAESGDYWVKVTEAGQLTDDGTYVVISQSGSCALNSVGDGNPVYPEEIVGHAGYYEIYDNDSGDEKIGRDHYWRFTKSGNEFTVVNQNNTNAYLHVHYSPYWGQSAVLGSGTADPLAVTQTADGTAWKFGDTGASSYWNTYYGYLMINNGSFGVTTSDSAASTYMQIFKKVDKLPDGGETGGGETGGGETDSNVPQKPTYAPYIEPSGSKTGDTAHAGVEGSYWSDPGSSKIEAHFVGDSSDDGMVRTDKSVIYGDDDYNAFDTYDPNTFGVALSALGQEFLTGNREVIPIPVDVMFVLDISGSMNANKVSTGETRTQAMVEAVNWSIADIMNKDPNNRVGAVLFSSGTGNLLELGRYEHANDEYLVVDQNATTWHPTSSTSLTGNFISLNNGLTKDGAAYTESTVDVYPYQMNGTYTQAGIALGAQKLLDEKDTTCAVTIFKGTPQETSVRVKRQPVIILLSDGEPSHCTSNYTDVLNGPHYGDGVVDSSYQGVYGYYTVLSANHYKQAVGDHYDQPTLFYSIGMGIPARGDSGEHDGSVYKRAVLDPTPARVAASSTIRPAYTIDQMESLLNNTYTGSSISVHASNTAYMPDWMGTIRSDVPVLKNPYTEYSYANQAYFGNYTPDALGAIFADILDASTTVSPYGFILRSRTSVDMNDPIGEGMEVKGDPVLRFDATNYSHTSKTVSADGKTVTYVYDHFHSMGDGSNRTYDLKGIEVQVITDENGLQNVYMNIPDYLLPAYSPYAEGLNAEDEPYFYYEGLPVRLLYQVGLTEQAQADVAALKTTGGERTYYTNRYDMEGQVLANAFLLPTNDNPYYTLNGGTHQNEIHNAVKTENTTGTYENSFSCHHYDAEHGGEHVPAVTQALGNNGKLVFAADAAAVTVKKQWSGVDKPNAPPITVTLYKVTETTVGAGETVTTVTAVQTGIIDAEGGWEYVFSPLAIPAVNEYYAIAETVPAGFAVSYEGETVELLLENGKTVKAAKADLSAEFAAAVTLTNFTGAILPNTGSFGSELYTVGGLALLFAALAILLYNHSKCRKEDFFSS